MQTGTFPFRVTTIQPTSPKTARNVSNNEREHTARMNHCTPDGGRRDPREQRDHDGWSGIFKSMTHALQHAASSLLLMTNESMSHEESSQVVHKHRKLFSIKAEWCVQRWSRGQCNIVDDRKLVSVINNEPNKQRWVRVGAANSTGGGGVPYNGDT